MLRKNESNNYRNVGLGVTSAKFIFEMTSYLRSLPQRSGKFSRFVTGGCIVCTKWLILHNAEMLRNLSAKKKDVLQDMTIITFD